MKRRDFLKSSLGASGGIVLGVGGLSTAEAKAGEARAVRLAKTSIAGRFYTPNRSPLQATAFTKLPTGSITPQGWIRQQLIFQAEGLCGRMPEVSDYLRYDGNGWVDAPVGCSFSLAAWSLAVTSASRALVSFRSVSKAIFF